VPPRIPFPRAPIAELSQSNGELVVRITLDGSTRAPAAAVITTRNCSDVVGLSPRQFRDLVGAGIIRGGRLPRSKAVVATLDDVLDAVRRAAEASPTDAAARHATTSAVVDDADAVLDAAGVVRRRRK